MPDTNYSILLGNLRKLSFADLDALESYAHRKSSGLLFDDPKSVSIKEGLSQVRKEKFEKLFVKNRVIPNKPIDQRKADFKEEVWKYKHIYGEEMLEAFFDHWAEHGANAKKMEFEKRSSFDVEKRLRYWHKRDQEIKGQQQSDNKPTIDEWGKKRNG